MLKKIEGLQKKYDESEREKHLLAEMAGECTVGQPVPEEIIAKYAAKFSLLERLKEFGPASGVNFAKSLAQSNEQGDPQFVEQIAVHDEYQTTWMQDIRDAKLNAQENLDALYSAN